MIYHQPILALPFSERWSRHKYHICREMGNQFLDPPPQGSPLQWTENPDLPQYGQVFDLHSDVELC